MHAGELKRVCECDTVDMVNVLSFCFFLFLQDWAAGAAWPRWALLTFPYTVHLGFFGLFGL